MQVLYDGNSNIIKLNGLQNAEAETYINTATVTVTLVDLSGNPISGETWPLTMDYVSGSNGNYKGILTSGLSLTSGQEVIAQISADGGAELDGYWEVHCIVTTRTIDPNS